MNISKLISLSLSLLIIFIPMISYGQSGEITIRFIGNCGLHISDGTDHIYSDFPYRSGAYNYMEYDASEIDNLQENAYYIFTHKHADHYYRGKVNSILKNKNGRKYGKWNIDKLMELSTEIPDFTIEAFRTKHAFSFNHYSYLIEWHGVRIYLSGDTESADTIMGIKEIDWAFVPAWIIRDAYMEKGKEIDAEMIGIYHIGPKDEIDIQAPHMKMFTQQGETIRIAY